MIEQIINIGHYVRENEDVELVDYMVNQINTDNINAILNIDVKSNGIETYTEEFYNGITQKALFYQAGNGVLGGAIRLDFYKDEEKEIKKFEKKIKGACEYCEVTESFEEVKKTIYDYIKDKGTNSFAVIKVDGKYPIELFKEKFLEKMYSTMYKSIKGNHLCHFCGTKGEVYNTVGYKFYTNDKEVYGNVDASEKSGVVICRECLDNIIIGKKYCEDTLTSFWLGKNVMFLPHTYTEDAAVIYESTKILDNGHKNFIDCISSSEEDVLDEIGRAKAETDIIFFEKDGSKTFYIFHSIRSVLPSRFSFLSECLKKYRLKLFIAIKYSTAIKVSIEGVESTFKEKMRFVDAVFTGKNIDRNIFFKRAMVVYKDEYLKNKHKVHGCMSSINRIYNFLVDCRCVKGGFDVMKTYKDYEELFNSNLEYFNSNEKKAWFLVGRCYDLMNYYIRKDNSSADSGNEKGNFDRTSLDKNFFFARKFDFKDFIYFCNLLSDKANKYKVNGKSFSNMLCEAKELMARKEGKLSFDEAKYLFFWGMDSYFEKEKEEVITAESDED